LKPFFRNIKRFVKSDERNIKYLKYAVGEILLIVIGILIAVQLNNWNEIRIIRNSEQILLKNLLAEMNVNYEQINNVIDFSSKSTNASKTLIEIYNDEHTHENSQELDSLLVITQWAFTFNPEMGALNSIKNSGKLDYIQNEQLRSMITSYEDKSVDALEESLLIRNLIINKYVPSVNQYISLNQRLKFLGEKYVVGKSKFEPDYNGLLNDRELESLISYIHTWRIDEAGETERLAEMTNKIISLIKREIKD
jgi:cytoskeletal protein RodZ